MCFLALLSCGCANIVPPSGGEKDNSPPAIISTKPVNKSILFDSKEIFLEFDEYIQLQNQSMIKISPKCENFNITQRGRSLKIDLLCPLEENTTYTINFGKSIVDLNEGNSLKNFKYIFSTGPSIDSLNVRGTTRVLYGEAESANILIGLYQNTDSLFPYYYSFSNIGDNFIIENIKAEKYIVRAFEDNNGNFNYDEGELTSFPFVINNLDTVLDLGLFYDDSRNNIVKNVQNTCQHSIRFEHAKLQDSIAILNTFGFWDWAEYSSIFWFNKSARFIKYQLLDFVDSIEIYSVDSTLIELKILNNIEEIKSTKLVSLKSNRPINRIDSTKFKWASQKKPVNPILNGKFNIIIPIDFEIKNQEEVLIIDNGAFLDFLGKRNDSTSFNIDFDPGQYGQLNIRSPYSLKNYPTILELYQNNDVIRQKILVEDSISMQFITPGKYNIRVFEDWNNDFLWSTGQISNNKKPEPTHIYPQTIDVKSNWEIDIELKR